MRKTNLEIVQSENERSLVKIRQVSLYKKKSGNLKSPQKNILWRNSLISFVKMDLSKKSGSCILSENIF
jgi:hypothetical protein